MHLMYGAVGCSTRKDERMYREKFRNRRASSELKDNSRRGYESTKSWSFKPQRAGQNAKQRSVRTPDFDTMDRVREAPSISTRQLVHESSVRNDFEPRVHF